MSTEKQVNLRTEIPGPKSRELRAREEKHMTPGLQRFAMMAGIVVNEGRGSTITDVDGNTFIDIIGGIGVNGLGHSHTKMVSSKFRPKHVCDDETSGVALPEHKIR